MTTQTTEYWLNLDTGHATCTRHAGFELAYRIENNPAKSIHKTPFGEWQRATPNDVYDLFEILGYVCDMCKK